MGFECRHLIKEFRTLNGTVDVLDDLTFTVGEEEFVCIVGPSGCGKTTLLKIIAGLLEPTSGEVSFAPEQINGYPHTAMVFQEHGVFPWMTVLDNVAFGLEMRGMGRRERRHKALSFIEKVGLGAFAHSYPHELSVGMRQRVGIARAFLFNPQNLLMDEPFGSLDSQTKLVLQEELLRSWREYRKSIIYITHDVEEAVLLGDRVLVMTGRPARLCEEITIPLPRPRVLTARDDPNAREIKWHIWKLLEKEVRKSLSITS